VLNFRKITSAKRERQKDTERHNALIIRASTEGIKTLQLLLRHLCIGLLSVSADLRLARPADSLQSLGQNGVAKVVGRVHPIGIHGGQVLDLEFDERRGNLGRVAELVGESIYVGSAFGLGVSA
jgi:hypothetical protein